MEPIDPRPDRENVPAGSKPELVAKHQPQFQTLPAVITPDGLVITRWRPSIEERRAIMNGEDIFLAVRTYGKPLQPLLMSVGETSWKNL